MDGVDPTNNRIFGDPVSAAEGSQFLVALREEDKWFTLNYQFTCDGYVQLIKIVDGTPVSIVAQFVYVGFPIKKKVTCTLINYLIVCSMIGELPEFMDSIAYSDSEYDFYIRKIRKDRAENRDYGGSRLTVFRARFDPDQVSKN